MDVRCDDVLQKHSDPTRLDVDEVSDSEAEMDQVAQDVLGEEYRPETGRGYEAYSSLFDTYFGLGVSGLVGRLAVSNDLTRKADPQQRICMYEVPGGGTCKDADCRDLHLSQATT